MAKKINRAWPNRNLVDLSVIIVSFNTKKLLAECISSVKKFTKELNYEIIVVDNASSDGSIDKARQLGAKVIKNKKNLGFGQANNQGMKISQGRYILLLNSDTLIKDNVLGEIVSWMDKNLKVGITSCALKFKDGKAQGTGGYFPSLPRVFAWMSFIDDIPFLSDIIKPYHLIRRLPSKVKGLDWLTGAFMLIRKDVVKDVGYFDKDYFMYVEEVDYCYRAKRAGWNILYNPKWNIIHYGGASSGKEFSLLKEVDGMKIFYKKHYPGWQYLPLRLILKFGAFLRMFIFGKTYAKILVSA